MDWSSVFHEITCSFWKWLDRSLFFNTLWHYNALELLEITSSSCALSCWLGTKMIFSRYLSQYKTELAKQFCVRTCGLFSLGIYLWYLGSFYISWLTLDLASIARSLLKLGLLAGVANCKPWARNVHTENKLTQDMKHFDDTFYVSW